MGISIHAPRVGRDPLSLIIFYLHFAISIHAPRVGRDTSKCVCPGATVISIHAPRVGRDTISQRRTASARRFQSTRPVWGATIAIVNGILTNLDISIHAPRVGRDAVLEN